MLHDTLKIIGVTGGSGAGKGELSSCFLTYGIKSIDADKVSRSVCEAGKPCLGELADYFGADILHADGSLDRHKLAGLVFGETDPVRREEKLNALNRITHRYILDEINAWLEARANEGDTLAVIDAPQLFESGYDKHCDYLIGVIADREVRIRRIIARDAMTRESAEKRLNAQKSDAFFIEHCDFIVYNNGGLSELQGQVENILKKVNYAK